MDNQNRKEIGFEISKETAAGHYSNLAIITHSGSEFVLDFARMLPGTPKAEICSRIIMTPEHAKRLYLALKDNIAKFESQNGEIKIKIKTSPKGTIPMSFGPGSAEA